MFIGIQLARARKISERRVFPHHLFAVGNKIKNFGLKDEKAAVNPCPISLRLFLKTFYCSVVRHLQRSKTSRRLDCR